MKASGTAAYRSLGALCARVCKIGCTVNEARGFFHTIRARYGTVWKRKKKKKGFRDQMKRNRVQMCHGMQMVASMFHAVALIPFSFPAIADAAICEPFAPFRASELQEMPQGVELGDGWSRRRKTPG